MVTNISKTIIKLTKGKRKMFKTKYDLLNGEYYLEILGIRVSSAIANLLVRLGVIQENEEV
jgi:hypothetical protein